MDPCAVVVEAAEAHQEEEVDSAATAVVAVDVADQEVEDLEHAVVEADSAEVRLEAVGLVLDVVVSAVAEEVEPLLLHYRTLSSRRLGKGNGVTGMLVSTWTIPSVYEKRYVVSKLGLRAMKACSLQMLQQHASPSQKNCMPRQASMMLESCFQSLLKIAW